MKGQILDYVISDSKGLISAEDGKRYSFSSSEWMSNEIHPKKEMKVDFVVSDEIATKIYPTGNICNDTKINIVQQQTSAAAVVSLIFGIAGILIGWWSLAVPSLLAIIFGHIARSNIKCSKGKLGGDGLALGGLILGYFTFITYLLIVIFFVGAIGFLGTY